jgi:hypothetical protein
MNNVSGYQKLKLQNEALLKTLEAERDPENIEKRLAAEAAQAAFLDATNTVGSAIAKALTGGPQRRPGFTITVETPMTKANREAVEAGAYGYSLTERIRKRREEEGVVTFEPVSSSHDVLVKNLKAKAEGKSE